MSTAKKFNKADIGKVLNVWRREFSVMVPSRDTGTTMFSDWDGHDTGFLSWYRNTVVSPKAAVLPPVEKMMSFQKEKGSYKTEVPANGRKQVIFGIRPCDAHAMKMLDDVFSEGYEDYYYQSRRQNTLLVGLGCTNPMESCFCGSMDVSPAASSEVDLMLVEVGEEYIAEAVTDKGSYLLEMAGITKNAIAADAKKAKAVDTESRKKLSHSVDTKGISDKLQSCFNDKELWENIAAKCVSCGICTFLCPTCFCFDINDEMFQKQGARYRGWDSCSFKVYTKMPMENPREEKWRRVRQRVCHKFEFYPMSVGFNACTGCGRCVRLCPVNWDITRVIAALPEPARSREKAAAVKG